MKLSRLLLASSLCALTAVTTGCSGIRKTDSTFYTHAESIRVLGYTFPGNDQQRARELVPANTNIVTVQSNPADWTSVLGVIGNILWVSTTQISGTIEK